MQTSMVFSQLRWPGITPKGDKDGRDIDDCWTLSAIQSVNVTAPWLRLVSVRQFRAAAERPDQPDEANGGQLSDIVRGVTRLFPEYASKLTVYRAVDKDTFLRPLKQHRPLSLAINAAKLPAGISTGFTGMHQVTLAMKANGRLLLADPLQPVYSRWQEVTVADIWPAIYGYGRSIGRPGAWFVAFPTDEEMLKTYFGKDDPTPFDQEDMDAVTAALRSERDELQRRVDGAIDALDG